MLSRPSGDLILPGPPEALTASSPIKKSRSSVPRFMLRWLEGPAPPVRKDGLFATAGRPEPEPAWLPAPPFVAMAVGNTNEGESFPAKPEGEHASEHSTRPYITVAREDNRTKLGEAGTAENHRVSPSQHGKCGGGVREPEELTCP